MFGSLLISSSIDITVLALIVGSSSFAKRFVESSAAFLMFLGTLVSLIICDKISVQFEKISSLFIISDIVILPNKIIFTYLILINKIKVIAHYINKEKRNNYFFILSLLFFFIYYRTYVKHNI